MKLSICLMSAFCIFQSVEATFVAPPNPLTVEWTVKASGAKFPQIALEGVTIETALKYLETRMKASGAVVTIDRSSIENRLEDRFTLIRAEVTWLQVLSIIADATDSSIIVGPGRYELLPNKP